MAETKWIKMNVYMFRHPKLLIIDSMENSDLIYYIWTSSVLLAGECNMGGCLYISENMPYSLKNLAIVFRRNEEEVKKAYDVLINLEMIEKTEEEIYRIKNWEKHQNIEGLEKIRKQTNERVARYRERKREEKRKAEEEKDDSLNTEKSTADDEASSMENDEIEKVSGTSKELALTNNEDKIIVDDEKVKIDDMHDSFRMQNDGNVTATQHNRIEKNNKNSKNKKRESKCLSHSQDDKKVIFDVDESESTSDGVELAVYCEKIIGKIGVLDIGALNLAVHDHGKEYVKQAIDKSIECGKINMAYINGILKNWRREGYPESNEADNNLNTKNRRMCGQEKNNKVDTVGGESYGTRGIIKDIGKSSGEFEGIRPRERKKLSDDKRKEYERNVI